MGTFLIFLLIFITFVTIGILDDIGKFKGIDSDVAAVLAAISPFPGAIALLLGVCMLANSNPTTGTTKEYQEKYSQYTVIEHYLEEHDEIEPYVYKEIVDYNSTVCAAKNEGFMTKGLHNKYYKKLPYIEKDGIVLFEEVN